MSILNQPLPPEELPTTRHTHLTDRVTQVLRDAMILPRQMESYDPAVSPETPVEDFNSHTYEDILATAILNKVLESCEGKRPDEVTIEVSHDVASTDTDSGMSGGAKESRRGRHKSEAGSEGSEERSLTPPARHTPAHRPPTASPDQGVVTDECWGPAYTAHDAPLQFKIEEHVEEVTTHHVTDEDEDEDEGDASDSGSWRGSRGSLEDRRRTRRHKKVTQHSVTQDPLVSCLPVALPDPTQVTSRRVSFPELGRDIIQDSCSDTECCTVSPSDMVVEADSWEENWLFRRQRLAGGKNSDPITMLIPNPEAHVTATVGNRDVDELSELSEQRSVCSSEPWSDSDGEGEGLYSGSPNAASRELSLLAGEIVAEFGQQDQEYTVDYSAASRMAARRTPPPHSPPYSKPSRPHSLPQHTRHPMEPSREYHNGRPARGTPRDSESVSDNERPVPKPRKLSLATTPSSKASDKSPGKPLLSPMEDLTILSPPLDVPLPSEAKSSSETVWFVETPQDCVVLQGRTLRLSCVLNTKRPMGLTWYHNGSLVQSGGQEVWAWRRGPTHHLHLYNMTPAAAGVYAAAAYTASHCVWAFCRVHYKASARPAKQPTFTKGLTNAAVEECGELTLQCQVQGHPEPRVTFSRGTQQLQPSSRLAIESDQYGTWTLRLSDCALVDAGEVTATASNTLASATCRCQVKVFPEGTPLPCQDTSHSSRQQKSQNNQQLKGRSGSKLTQRTSHPGPHLSDNTARTPSTAALITPSHLQLEDSLTTSSDAKRGGREQEDIQQVPTKPGTIAEREHRKWEAAVPLPNNPYSPERLAHRLSHSRPPDHAIYTRSSSVEVDLDPSLQDGVPCRADLNRYSRDYYVAGSTNGTAAARSRSNFVNHQKHGQENYQTPKPQPLTNGCHTPPTTSQQVTRNGQVCHTLPQMHVAAPCMSVDGIEALKVPFSYQPPTHDCDPTLHHPSPVLPTPSNCSAFHFSDNTSRTVSRSKGRETLSAEPGKLHISIIDRLDKSRVSLPSSPVTLGPNRGLKQEGILSTATPVTQPDSHNSLYEKTRQSVSISSSSTMSSPVSSLVTPLLPESPGIRELEGNFIHHNLARLSFRSRKTTREFSLNPLFEDEDRVQGGDSVETHSNRAVLQPVEPLSDYYSSYESLPYLSSFSREGSLKLPKPQVTEEVFESLSDVGGSLRLSKRKSSLKSWGSFKHKRSMMF